MRTLALSCAAVLSTACHTEADASHADQHHAEAAIPAPADLVIENTGAFDAGMVAALPAYLAIQETLAADSLDGVADAGRAFAAAAAKLDTSAITGAHANVYKGIPAQAEQAARATAAASNIRSAREAFKALSKSIAPWAAKHRPRGIDLVWCSMYPGGWLQKQGEIRNPYYGKEMLVCGEKS